MTRDEILKLPAGGDIDELVAEKVMGFRVYRNESMGHHIAYPDKESNKYWFKPIGQLGTFCNWSPSTDIATAWEVVSATAKEPFAWYIESVNIKDKPVIWWVGYWGGPTEEIFMYSAEDESLSLAICRAALLFTMGLGRND